MKKVLEAAFFAANKHTNQRRKNIEDTPYINHLIEVAHILASSGGITDEDILSAAFLHDTIEDTGTKEKEISDLFGTKISGYVMEVTDNKSLPKAERKRLQEVHAGSLSEGAVLIKIADRISNLRAIATVPPQGWSMKRQITYYDWSDRVFRNMKKTGNPVERLFAEEFDKGYQILLQRKAEEHSLRSWVTAIRRNIRARCMRLGRYGTP
jgi:GTP diphosphokinase / guanosine-3',5'-bis(diphosphate) 3'-diphosphatase